MLLKQWSIPVERTYAAPIGRDEAPRSLRSERRIDLIEDHGRLHVFVDHRKVLHKEHDGELVFGIGKYGCVIRRTGDDYDLLVGGKRIEDMPSVFPVALRSDPPPTETGFRLDLPPRLVAAIGALLLLVIVMKLVAHAAGASPSPVWREVSSAEGGFTADLPGSPSVRVETQTRDGLTLTLSTTAARVEPRALFAVVWADLPLNADGTMPVAEACALSVNAAVAEGGSMLASPPEITRNDALGSAGCHLEATVKRAWRAGDLLSVKGFYDHRMTIEARGTVVGERLYVRVAIVDPELGRSDVQRFFDGVHLAG